MTWVTKMTRITRVTKITRMTRVTTITRTTRMTNATGLTEANILFSIQLSLTALQHCNDSFWLFLLLYTKTF